MPSFILQDKLHQRLRQQLQSLRLKSLKRLPIVHVMLAEFLVIQRQMAWNVYRSSATLAADMVAEKKLFKFSLLYLACLFGALVADVLLLP